jgi:hypothetical protein
MFLPYPSVLIVLLFTYYLLLPSHGILLCLLVFPTGSFCNVLLCLWHVYCGWYMSWLSGSWSAPNDILWGVATMKLLTMNLSPASCYIRSPEYICYTRCHVNIPYAPAHIKFVLTFTNHKFMCHFYFLNFIFLQKLLSFWYDFGTNYTEYYIQIFS